MPPDDAPVPNGATEEELYGASYYASHCGAVPYERNDHWLGFFGRVADELQRAFAPQTVFDAGCALGLLVESLWDRGVEAHGRDISAWAIEHARPDIRGFCSIGSIAEPIEGHYDLLTCIEVLEHIPEQDALRAITEMAKAAPRILFPRRPSTSPNRHTVTSVRHNTGSHAGPRRDLRPLRRTTLVTSHLMLTFWSALKQPHAARTCFLR